MRIFTVNLDSFPLVKVADSHFSSFKAPMLDKKYIFDYQFLIKAIGCQTKLGTWIRNHLNVNGLLVLQNVDIDGEIESSKQFMVELCSTVGSLIEHNPREKDFVWEIRPRLSRSSLKTFSEHNDKAPLHTDSQYRNHPERFIALLTLRQASCGGGYTELVDFRKVLQDLEKTASGSEVIQFISNERFPIAVPTIFQNHLEQQYIRQTLISESPLIRYRYDTLKAGLSLLDKSKVSLYEKNLAFLDAAIQLSPHRFRFLSSPNEVIFLDNHRFLHGRSSFIDPDRLLLRTRMN